MTLPSSSTIPVSAAALARATCDGEGLITLPTPDGPEHFACLGCRHCTPGALPLAQPSRHTVMADLLKAIRQAGSRDELSALWAAHQDIWTEWCTKVGQIRLAAVEAKAGTGGAP